MNPQIKLSLLDLELVHLFNMNKVYLIFISLLLSLNTTNAYSKIVYIDINLICEKPSVVKNRGKIIKSLSKLLQIKKHKISQRKNS